MEDIFTEPPDSKKAYFHALLEPMIMLTILQITKKEVDSFSPGRRIPSCQLKAQWTKKSKPSQFTHKVTLEGAKEPSNYFCIDFDCDSTTPGI